MNFPPGRVNARVRWLVTFPHRNGRRTIVSLLTLEIHSEMRSALVSFAMWQGLEKVIDIAYD